MSRAGGGWMVEQRDMTPERLAKDLAGLIGDPDRLAAAAAAARRSASPTRSSGSPIWSSRSRLAKRSAPRHKSKA